MKLSLHQLLRLQVMLQQLVVFAECEGSRLEAHVARLLCGFVEARIARAEVEVAGGLDKGD